jgi:small-conductance mechanosensitive channel
VSWTAYLPAIISVLIAAAFAVGGYLLSRSAAAWLRQRGAPPHGVHTIRKIIYLLGLAMAALTLFIAFGPLTVVTGLTVSAIIGLVIALALQTTIANVIAGVILLRDGVLRLDDRIQIGSMNGKVVQLGLVTVWLRLDDGTLAVVSNSTLLSGPFRNQSVGDRLKGEY